MLKNSLFSAVLVMAAAGVAHAGGQAGSIGIGAEFQISGTGGASLNYDAGDFHVGGFLGYADDTAGAENQFDLGARFYYHLHSTAMADFGVGGSIGILSADPPGGGDRVTGVFLEPGVQIRLFLASNVAISASTGIMIGTADADGVLLTGQTIGAGLHYYFF